MSSDRRPSYMSGRRRRTPATQVLPAAGAHRCGKASAYLSDRSVELKFFCLLNRLTPKSLRDRIVQRGRQCGFTFTWSLSVA